MSIFKTLVKLSSLRLWCRLLNHRQGKQKGALCALGPLVYFKISILCVFIFLHTAAELERMEACFRHLDQTPTLKLPPKYPTLSEVTPRVKQHKHVTSSYENPNWEHRARHARKVQASFDTDSDSDDNNQQDWTHFNADKTFHGGTSTPLGIFPGLMPKQSSSNDEGDEDDGSYDEVEVNLDVLELLVLLLTLCKNLCCRESIGGSEGMAVSLALLPHLSRFLLSLQEEYPNGDLQEWCTDEAVAFVKRHTVRTIITVASYASLQPNGIPSLAASGAVTSLLEAAKQNLLQATKQDPFDSITESSPLVVATDILHGTWLLLHSIFGCIPLNPTFLKCSLKLLGQVMENQGLRLLQTALSTWEVHFYTFDENSNEADFARGPIFNLIDSLARLMTSMKKAKINYIHSIKCLRTRHKTCDYSQYKHHHHDVLGIASSALTENRVSGFYFVDFSPLV